MAEADEMERANAHCLICLAVRCHFVKVIAFCLAVRWATVWFVETRLAVMQRMEIVNFVWSDNTMRCKREWILVLDHCCFVVVGFWPYQSLFG